MKKVKVGSKVKTKEEVEIINGGSTVCGDES